MDHSHGVKDAKDQEEDEGDAEKYYFTASGSCAGILGTHMLFSGSSRYFQVCSVLLYTFGCFGIILCSLVLF